MNDQGSGPPPAIRRTVLHVLDTWLNLDASYFRSLLQQHAADYEVGFCLLDEPPGGPWDGTAFGGRVWALDARRWQYPAATLRLARELRRRRVALVHAHFFYPTLVAIAASRIAGVPVVYTRHHSDHNLRLGKRRHVRLDGWAGRRASHVIAVSHAVKELMVAVEGVPASHISVVYNGMRPLPEPSKEELAFARSSLGVDDRPLCLMIARLHEEKGHRVLFDALPTVLTRYGPVQCLLAGEGPHRAALEAEVLGRGLGDHVTFLGRRRDIPALILLSRVVMLPSLAESFGYAVLEAMSLGRPVVTSDTGGLPELVRDGVTGLVVPKGDHSALASALVAVLADRDLADRLAMAGPDWARQFSYDKMIEGYERVYRRLWEAPA